MQRYGLFGLGLIMVSAVACAPVVHDASYHEYRTTPAQVAVYTSHTVVYPRAQTIEVMLYADRTYRGVYFQPMRLVISEGQYVEIPVRDKRGRQTRIYAHYHQQNLHFDHDRNCRALHGSARYSYDRKWDTGHRYSNLNAGKDYDLTGLHLEIRNISARQIQSETRGFEQGSRQEQVRSQQAPTTKAVSSARGQQDSHSKAVDRVENQPVRQPGVRDSGSSARAPQQIFRGDASAGQNTRVDSIKRDNSQKPGELKSAQNSAAQKVSQKVAIIKTEPELPQAGSAIQRLIQHKAARQEERVSGRVKKTGVDDKADRVMKDAPQQVQDSFRPGQQQAIKKNASRQTEKTLQRDLRENDSTEVAVVENQDSSSETKLPRSR